MNDDVGIDSKRIVQMTPLTKEREKKEDNLIRVRWNKENTLGRVRCMTLRKCKIEITHGHNKRHKDHILRSNIVFQT